VTLLFRLLRRFAAKSDKKIVDCQVASPSSWKTTRKLLARQISTGYNCKHEITHQPAEWGTEDMAEGSGSQKVNPNLVPEIVSSYVAKNSVPVDQVGVGSGYV
jgi:hypothetical protein